MYCALRKLGLGTKHLKDYGHGLSHHLAGYLWVMETNLWGDFKAIICITNLEDMTLEAIRAYLDTSAGGLKNSPRVAKHTTLWAEIVLFMTVAILQMNLYAMLEGKGGYAVSKWERRRIDWAELMAEALQRELSTKRKKPTAALLVLFGFILPAPS